MKNILCYGDSNTFGWDPEESRRPDRDQRWPGVLEKELGADYHVIEEGLPGRTTVFYDPVMNLISGLDYLYPCLYSHQPLDMIIIMLGTNDLKYLFNAAPFDVFQGLERVVKTALYFESDLSDARPQLFLVSPARIIAPKAQFTDMFRGAEEKSLGLAAQVKALALKYGALYLNAADIVEPSPADGIHFNIASHRILGKRVAEAARDYFGKK
ncbi:MAG: SGNH/GDSL hydrolase family protein [Treponema sp.]|jgi:lysophospholipase L1-like esterase|nr:SGNH/GDSL hydrolase family protein [Treponema sp.]